MHDTAVSHPRDHRAIRRAAITALAAALLLPLVPATPAGAAPAAPDPFAPGVTT